MKPWASQSGHVTPLQPITGHLCRVEAALVEPERGAHVSQEAVHLGAGGGALAEAPLLAARPVADWVCWVLLGQITLDVRGRTSQWSLNIFPYSKSKVSRKSSKLKSV